jgi:hypothetical protein
MMFDQVAFEPQQTMPPGSRSPMNDRITPKDKLLTPQEVCQWMDVKMNWLKDHTTRSQPIVPHIRMGKVIRFRRTDIAEFIERQLSAKPTTKSHAETKQKAAESGRGVGGNESL